MRALTATAMVRPDHSLTLQVPVDIPPGPRTVVIVLEDPREVCPGRAALKFSPHPAGPANPADTYRREDLYDDHGR
jgi:hypothetical protein